MTVIMLATRDAPTTHDTPATTTLRDDATTLTTGTLYRYRSTHTRH